MANRIVVQYAPEARAEATPPPPARVRAWAEAALGDEETPPRRSPPAEITVRFVGARESAELNRAYRGKDKATNVLAFEYAPAPVAGDIALCAAVAEDEARRARKSREARYARLVVHGVLHLAGMRHETDGEARAMTARENRILRAFAL